MTPPIHNGLQDQDSPTDLREEAVTVVAVEEEEVAEEEVAEEGEDPP